MVVSKCCCCGKEMENRIFADLKITTRDLNSEEKENYYRICSICGKRFCLECESEIILWCKECYSESDGRGFCDDCEQWVDDETIEQMDDNEYRCGHCGMPLR